MNPALNDLSSNIHTSFCLYHILENAIISYIRQDTSPLESRTYKGAKHHVEPSRKISTFVENSVEIPGQAESPDRVV